MHLLDPKQTANTINVSNSWLSKARRTGNGPKFIKIGRRVVYHPDDVAEYINAHRVRSTSEAA